MTPIPIQPVLSPSYWRERIGKALVKEEIHRAVYETTLDEWRKIEDHQRKVLRTTLRPTDSVLDVGCAWGRLLSMMPQEWKGDYTGIDASPDFINMALTAYPTRRFIGDDMRVCHEHFQPKEFDWAILCSIKGTLTTHLGELFWRQAESSIKQVCKKMLFIDYDLTSEVVECQ